MTRGTADGGPCFLVLGMHRSGTSLVAGLLGGMGLRHATDLLKPNAANPAGFWESRALVDFDTARLDTLGRHWSDPKPLPDGWAEGADTSQSTALLENLFGAPGGALLKDPRLSRLMPLWRVALDRAGVEPACLILCRHPLEVAASLYRRDGMIEPHALELWLTHMLEAESGTRGLRRAVIRYDALMDDWRGALASAFAALDLPLPETEPPEELTPRLPLRHHALGAADLTKADPRVRDLWALLSAPDWADRPGDFDRIAQDHRRHWAEISPGDGGSDLPDALPAALLEKAAALLAEGKGQAAMQALQLAVEKGPQMARTHHRLGLMYLRRANWRRAIATLGRAVELDPSIAVYHRKYIEALYRAGRFDEALKAAELALSIHPDAPGLSYQVGQILLRHDHAEAAEGPLRRAIEVSGGDPAQYQALAKALRRQGRTGEAAEALREALAGEPDSAVLRAEYAALLVACWRYEAALEEAQTALRLKPRDPMALRVAITCLTGLGRHAEALEMVRTAAKAAPENPFFRDRLAYLCAVQGDTAGAAAAVEAQLVADARACGLRLENDGTLQAGDLRPPRDVDAATFLRLIRERAARHWTARLRDRPATSPAGAALWPDGPALPAVPVSTAPPGPEDRPLSIMLPVHDPRPDWLGATLDAVLEQAPQDAEVVILDDGSASDVARQAAARRGERVAYRRNAERLGLIGNHRACFDQARGALVHILHQDDRILPGFYDALLPPLQKEGALVGAASAVWLIDETGARTQRLEAERDTPGPVELSPRLRVNQRIQFAAMITRRAAYYAAGGFADGLRYAFDLELWERLCARGPLWHEPMPLAEYRLHGASATSGFDRHERVLDELRAVAMIAARHLHGDPTPALSRVFRRPLRDFAGLPPDARAHLSALALDGWGGDERAWAEAVFAAIAAPVDA